jgi:hypothetical protein
MHARSPLPEGRVDLNELLPGYANSGFAIAADYLDSNWNLVFHSVASLQTR